MGLERTLCILNGVDSVYETDIFEKAIAKIEELTGKKYGESEEVTKAFRVDLDHVRTATFMLGDDHGIVPSNTDQGYILRRVIAKRGSPSTRRATVPHTPSTRRSRARAASRNLPADLPTIRRRLPSSTRQPTFCTPL